MELAASVLLTVVDWPVFDYWFQLRGAELTVDYRRKLLELGLVNGLAFVAYERFVIPHRSLDEDPVTARPPGAIVTDWHDDTTAEETTGAAGGTADEEDDGSGAAHPVALPRSWWLWRCLNNRRANGFLPKFGHRTPLFQKGSLVFG